MEAAWGIYRTFLRLGVPYRATIELKIFDEENYLRPVVHVDGKIYHTHFLAHRATPTYNQMTAEEVTRFTHEVAEVISTSQGSPYIGFITFSIFDIDDTKLTMPLQVIRWKASKGILAITGETVPNHKQ